MCNVLNSKCFVWPLLTLAGYTSYKFLSYFSSFEAVFLHLQGGVIKERCYGCGRCFPICPYDNISEYDFCADLFFRKDLPFREPSCVQLTVKLLVLLISLLVYHVSFCGFITIFVDIYSKFLFFL